MIKKDVGYCWEKRDVIAESGHLFRLVKAGFIREHEFLIIGKEKKILQVANSLYLCSRKKKRDVAQLASAPRSGRGGRTFESSHPDYLRGCFKMRQLFFYDENSSRYGFRTIVCF